MLAKTEVIMVKTQGIQQVYPEPDNHRLMELLATHLPGAGGETVYVAGNSPRGKDVTHEFLFRFIGDRNLLIMHKPC